MIKEQRHIDLHLPTGWNQATTEELEHIAAAILDGQQRIDRYHPFDWERVKLMVVLGVNKMQVVSQEQPAEEPAGTEPADSTWLVKRDGDDEPWPISTGQIYSLCERLQWLDDEKADKTVFQFPYQEITLRRTAEHSDSDALTVVGPPPLLDGYTWQEYRWLTDWMQEYLRIGNALVAGNGNRERLLQGQQQVRNEFLAVLFKRKDGASGETADGKQALDAAAFASFDAVQWQVILFWWSSLMAILARKFPKVFKSQQVPKRRQKADTPWDFYNRVIATIQKYVGGLSEQDVNTASYGTILQQLDMMAREAEEMERLNKKYKK